MVQWFTHTKHFLYDFPQRPRHTVLSCPPRGDTHAYALRVCPDVEVPRAGMASPVAPPRPAPPAARRCALRPLPALSAAADTTAPPTRCPVPPATAGRRPPLPTACRPPPPRPLHVASTRCRDRPRLSLVVHGRALRCRLPSIYAWKVLAERLLPPRTLPTATACRRRRHCLLVPPPPILLAATSRRRRLSVAATCCPFWQTEAQSVRPHGSNSE